MKPVTAGFIGFGLIGGSIARGLKKHDPLSRVIAYSQDRSSLETAVSDRTADLILTEPDETFASCDVIFLCTPVEYNADYLNRIRPFLGKDTILTDVGSTKTSIHETVRELGLEDRFIGGHPMAGSEKTGYENSSDHLLENAYYVITPTAVTSQPQIDFMKETVRTIGAIPLVLDPEKHDYIAAAISHLPHLVASTLVNLVRDCDDENQTMKLLAAGGFKDITRIASSSPVMWEQICMTNDINITELLDRYIGSLTALKESLGKREEQPVMRLFETSRDYRNSFADRAGGSIRPEFSFSVEVVDEPGAISIISTILAGKGISIKNIGINHNREQGEGALRISFYDEASMEAARSRLRSYNYTLHRD